MMEPFAGKFQDMIPTYHPANIPGEQSGKGSNEAWTFKKLVLE